MKSRKIAVEILAEVEEGAYLNLAVKKHLKGLEEQKRRFAAALVYTTLENLLRIDYVIDYFAKANRIHRYVRNVLRIGVCQLMFFESVPVSAAVNESVKMIAASKKRQLKGFVNAVLRNVAEHLGEVAYPAREQDPAGFLSIMYSYPRWIAQMYIKEYGFDFAWEMLSYHKPEAYTSIRINHLKADKESLQRKLEGRGLHFIPGQYVSDCLYIKNISSVDELDLYRKGLLTVQGESSMLVCRAADVQPGDRVLDVCAAPGGKTAYLAERQPAYLQAWDLHEHRVQLMQENFTRLGVNAEVMVQDATVLRKDAIKQFDVVLVDAPCSALGLLYRKPDIKFSKTDEDLQEIVQTQKNILKVCAEYVKPGGTLIYSTCTINRQENEENFQWFLQKCSDFEADGLLGGLPEQLIGRVKAGGLQLFPHLDGVDGFFIAKARRKKND